MTAPAPANPRMRISTPPDQSSAVMKKLLFLFFPMALVAFLFLQSQAGEGVVQCANLIYAGTKTSRCFSDQFLTTMQQKTAIPAERRFRSVKLGSDELFDYPFVMMTGESSFFLSSLFPWFFSFLVIFLLLSSHRPS